MAEIRGIVIERHFSAIHGADGDAHIEMSIYETWDVRSELFTERWTGHALASRNFNLLL